MDFVTIICILLWLWGAYKRWGIVSGWEWEWINRKEPLNYVAKGAFCILLGFVFVLKQLWNFVMKLISFMF
ncbi:MAG: hypothetical protein K1W40_12230 [Schaedlerella sp.]|uniref:hypothetical protein n=1 Tax=Schaedlerella sp. TaxID=2676057 RepID=UPI0035277304